MNQPGQDDAGQDGEARPGSGLATRAETAADTRSTPRRRRRSLLAWLLAVLLLLPLLAAATLYWTLTTASGSAWLLARVPGLQVEAPEGALLGDFSARSLRWQGQGLHLEIRALQTQDTGLVRGSGAVLPDRLRMQRLSVERLDLSWTSSPGPATAPQDLRLPLGLELAVLQIGELRLAPLGIAPLRELDAELRLGLPPEPGARQAHVLRLRQLRWDRLSLSGQLGLQAEGEMRLDSRLQLVADEALRAELALQGPLAAPRMQLDAERSGQHLKGQAGLRPFASWPLAELQLSLADFDLGALHSALPHTRLSGQAALDASAWERPARLQARLDNHLAGPWDRQLLPLRLLRLDLQVRPDRLASLEDLRQLRVDALELQLGSADAPAGRLVAEGQGLQLQAKISGLRSRALDTRLPDVRMSGAMGLRALTAAAGAAPADRTDAAAETAEPRIALDASLSGDWLAPGRTEGAQPLKLQLRALLGADGLRLDQAELRSGASRAELRGQVLRSAGGWRSELQAEMRDLDPRLFWSGDAQSAWQRGPHAINATLDARIATTSGGWPEGRAELQLAPSVLAGLRLDGRAQYQLEAGRTKPSMSAELRLAENQLRLTGESLDPDSPRLQADLVAPRLESLQPLVRLWAAQAQLSGSLQASAQLQGRRDARDARSWQFDSNGEARIQTLKLKGLPGLAPLALQTAQVGWRGDTLADAPLSLRAELNRLSLAGGQLNRLLIDLQGSWLEHRITLQAQGHLPTPDWALPLIGEVALAGQTQLDLRGELSTSPWDALTHRRPMDWSLRADELLLRPQQEQRPALLAGQNLQLALRWDPQQGLQRAELAPGRLMLAGATLRWSRLAWAPPRRAGLPPELQAELTLDPLQVAPLLARWQPDFGWSGDLVMDGRLHLRSTPQVEVDLEMRRVSGDLLVRDDGGPQALGLSELRLALIAQDGVWHFTQGIAGSTLGVLGGAITAHGSPLSLWPDERSRLEGVLQARVDNLGTWGGWVPAGWRMGGRIDAGISLAGRLGAPQIVGRAQGREIALRNPLQGVNVREGEFVLKLDGPTATLERFRASAGQGTLEAQGEVHLAEAPHARIRLQAERFALLSRVDRRLTTSGQAQLDLQGGDLKLDGRFAVDEGLFDFSHADAPSLDADVQVLRPDRAPPESRASRPRREHKIDVRLALDLGRKLRLRGRGLETLLRGDLVLTHDGGTPALNGTLRTEGGTFEAYGQKLEIEKGEISFAGVIDNPRLDVLAVRPNIDARVGVALGGTALNPRIKLFSEPEMADTDKLSWLVLGRAPEGLGRTDTALLQRAALALLSGSGEGTSGRLLKSVGLDEFSVGQGGDDSRGTVVRLGKQISRRLYLGYERGLNATSGNWQLIYRIARRFTLRAQSGDENAVDLIWQWKWD